MRSERLHVERAEELSLTRREVVGIFIGGSQIHSHLNSSFLYNASILTQLAIKPLQGKLHHVALRKARKLSLLEMSLTQVFSIQAPEGLAALVRMMKSKDLSKTLSASSAR